MKTVILRAGLILLAAMPFAHGGPAPERTGGPCFRVTIQNDQVNNSDVQQNCDQNISRTVQVGAMNRARTIQSGGVNDSKSRQYHFDSARYFSQMDRIFNHRNPGG